MIGFQPTLDLAITELFTFKKSNHFTLAKARNVHNRFSLRITNVHSSAQTTSRPQAPFVYLIWKLRPWSPRHIPSYYSTLHSSWRHRGLTTSQPTGDETEDTVPSCNKVMVNSVLVVSGKDGNGTLMWAFQHYCRHYHHQTHSGSYPCLRYILSVNGFRRIPWWSFMLDVIYC